MEKGTRTALASWLRLAETLRADLRMMAHAELVRWWEITGLETRRPNTLHEANALVILGNAYQACTAGIGAENFQKSVVAYRAALTWFTRAQLPQQWAMTQNNLGNALRDLAASSSKVDKAMLRLAIEAHEKALDVFTEESFPGYCEIVIRQLLADYAIAVGGEERLRNLLENGGLDSALKKFFDSEDD